MSSESLKSLIVTDPDIVDEGIDISGLRTQTDTDPRLLASIADFPGISYDPTSFDIYQILMNCLLMVYLQQRQIKLKYLEL